MQTTLILNKPFLVKHHLSLRWKINLRSFQLLSLILIIALLVFYVFQVNFLTRETYLIQSYEKELNQLLLENETLEINSSQVSSLGNIEVLIKDLGFEKVDQIHYIRAGGEYMVRSDETKTTSY